tara:strand:+ start:12928 stop:13533 length:606 start_codon:yes stop_codon:yes gene_type:complete
MKDQQDYIQDIAEIRSMMERSSKFISLSGWAGILAGLYALIGAWLSYSMLRFNPDEVFYSSNSLPEVILLAVGVLILSLITAIFFSQKKAGNNGDTLWNPTSKRLLSNMMIPFFSGGVLILILVLKGLIGFVAPVMLIFYGLSLFVAGNFTLKEVKILGITQIALGLANAWFIEFGLLFWAIGFGVVHLIYGIYMHFKYER